MSRHRLVFVAYVVAVVGLGGVAGRWLGDYAWWAPAMIGYTVGGVGREIWIWSQR